MTQRTKTFTLKDDKFNDLKSVLTMRISEDKNKKRGRERESKSPEKKINQVELEDKISEESEISSSSISSHYDEVEDIRKRGGKTNFNNM